ncbi:nucleoside triphosphate pyrophosphohydrolase [bacterium]|nr:nucleoside triphosphate pyrophosphohydrolase [bacterium]MBU1752474.1 nucleoside triphosphate pyrophosphohydrolase [bacterium]
MQEHPLDRLVEIIAKLRSPEGCPWDREQTSQTLKPYLVEETYEVLEAIDEGNPEHLKEEMGDLLAQLLIHIQVVSEQGWFTVVDVLNMACEKLIRRHPHVFGDLKLETVADVMVYWEAIKRREKGLTAKDISAATDRDNEVAPLSPCPYKSVINGIPKNLPSLLFAHCVQDKIERVGYEWPKAQEILEGLTADTAKLQNADDIDAFEELLGTLLFSLVSLARLKDIDAEGILRRKVKEVVEGLQAG